MKKTQGSFRCPSCQVPVLVGEYSITIDRKRIELERFRAIEKAARYLLDSRDIQGGIEKLEAAIKVGTSPPTVEDVIARIVKDYTKE